MACQYRMSKNHKREGAKEERGEGDNDIIGRWRERKCDKEKREERRERKEGGRERWS